MNNLPRTISSTWSALVIAATLGCGTGGAPMTGTTTTPSGGGAAAAGCPSDLATLVGQPCSDDGRSCGSAGSTGFSNIVVCKTGRWQQVEVPPPPGGTIACGDRSCTLDQTCIEISTGSGVQSPPNRDRPPALSHECAAAPMASTGGISCAAAIDHRQSCVSLVPVARPPG